MRKILRQLCAIIMICILAVPTHADSILNGVVNETNQGVSFHEKNNNIINNISFSVMNDVETEVVPTVDNGVYYFELPAGTSVSYKISQEPYADCTGVFVLGDVENVEVEFTEKPSCGLSCEPIVMTYEDVLDVNEVAQTVDGYTGALSCSSEDSSVIQAENNILTAVHPGETVIHITAETTEYAGSEILVSVTVNKKDLALTDVTWGDAVKTYDGNPELTVNGTSGNISFQATVISESANVGNWPSTVSLISENEYYNLIVSEGPSCTIQKADVDVSLDDMAVVYGDDAWRALSAGNVPDWQNWIHAQCIVGTDEMQEELDAMTGYAEPYVNAESFEPGVITDAVKVTLTDPEGSNFHFVSSGGATVTVQNAIIDDVWNMLTILDDSEVYKKDDVYYAAPGAHIKVAVNSDLYDKAIFRIGDVETVNEFHMPYTLGTVQLGNTKSANILSDSDMLEEGQQPHIIPDNAILLDDEAPAVNFSDELGTYTTADAPSFEDLAMVVFRNTGYDTSVNIQDMTGVALATYSLVKITDQEDAEKKIREASAFETWEPLPETIHVPGTDEGYWLVLIGAKDNVGNSVIAASNGIVIDVTKPEVAVSIPDGAHKGDVPFHVTARDKDGLARIDVTANGSLYHWDNETSATIGTLSEEQELDLTLPSTNGNVTVHVEAEDRSGNVAEVTRVVNMDTESPAISVSFDNNEPKNGVYFNKARTMTVAIRERNFDPKNTGFMLSLNGVESFVTMEEAADILTLVEHTDSENEMEYTDERVNTYVFRFDGKDVDYRVVPYSTDLAGNVGTVDYGESKAYNNFTVDMVPPVVTHAFKDWDGGITRDAVTSIFSVNERNFTQDISLSVTGAANGDIPVKTEGVWDGQNYRVTYETEARYLVSAVYTDLAGNSTTLEPFSFTYDKTAPSGKLYTVANGNRKEKGNLSDETEFDTFSKDDVLFEHSENDDVSGIAYVMYAIYTPDASARGRFRVPGLSELENMTWILWDDVSIRPDAQGVIYMKAVDNAGNAVYLNSNGVIAEGTAPGPSVSITTDEKEYYDADVPIFISVEDIENGGTYSGLKYVRWNVAKDGVVTQNGEQTFESSTRTKAYSQPVTVDSAKNNSNDVLITVETEDYAGNYAITRKAIRIDITKPTIKVSYDHNQPLNGRYFNQDRTMTLTVQERNFDPSKTRVAVTVDGITISSVISELQAPGVTVSGPEEEGEGDSRKHIYTLRFGGGIDKDYEFNASTFDLAGNRNDPIDYGDSAAPTSFTIDEVAPVLQYSFTSENGEVPAGTVAGYYGSVDVTASVKVTERNHSEGNLRVTASGSNASGLVDIESEGTWNGQTYSIVYTKDANYTFEASYTDLAGNSAALEKRFFTVDKTSPEGTLTTTYNGHAKDSSSLLSQMHFGSFWHGAVRVTQSNSDETSGVASVMYFIYIPGDVHGEFPVPNVESLRNMDWQEWKDIQVSPNSQAVIFLRVADRAGNIRYISSADGIIADDSAPGPVITITSGTAIFNGNVPFGISVTDPLSGGTYAGLKSVHWTVSKDGTVTQTGDYDSEFADPSARKQSISKRETVDASKNNSNNVVIYVEAEDYAGNKSSSSRSLSIDITPPTVQIRYDNNEPLNGKYFNKPRTMTVTFTERNFVPSQALLQVSINGESKTVPAGNLTGTGIVLIDSSDNGSGDSRTVRYTYRFGNGTDIDYDVTASITDGAGNTSSGVDFGDSNPQRAFTIDEVLPQMDFSYLDGSGKPVAAGTSTPVYDRQSITATANITERNFAANGLSLKVSAVDASGKAVRFSNSGTWTEDGILHMFRTPYVDDGNYTIEATFTDLAGNVVTYGKHYFTVDKTAPVGSMRIFGTQETSSNIFNEIMGFRLFTRQALQVSQTCSDETSGIDRVQYYLYVPDIETHGEFSVPLSRLSSFEWRDWTPLVLRPNMQTVVYIRFIDKAGNITYINSRDGVVLDDTAPENPVISLNIDADENIYNRDVPFTIAVADPGRGGTYAGLKSVHWTVSKDGEVTQSGNYDDELTVPEARIRTITHSERVDSSLNNSNNVRILVEVEDYAGNTSRAEKTLMVDITKPVVEVTYDLNEPENEIYYRRKRTATVTVNEHNFSADKVHFETKGVPGNWKTDGDIHTCPVVFEKDDDYRFAVQVTDMAGNAADYNREDHFVIDTKSPVIGVTYDVQNKDDNIYYNKNRTAVIVVKDKNFNEDDFTKRVLASFDGKDVKSPSLTKWVHKDDLHSTMMAFKEDAEYSFELSCKDLAGNASAVFTQKKFVIDKIKPSVSFEGVKNHSANRGDVKPLIRYSDVNFDPDGIHVLLEGANHEEITIEGKKKQDGNKGAYQLSDFRHEKEVDDIYTLTASYTDLAGNTTKKKITFSVNRFGSVYTFDEKTEDFLDTYYVRSAEDLVIKETNVDSLRNIGITVGFNGHTTRLSVDENYKAKKEMVKNGWTVWTYTIPKSNFTDEGLYEVRIESVDDAGNRQDNSLKNSPIAFAVDKTPPSVILTGIQNGKRYTETEKEMDISLLDNISLGDAQIYIDGVPAMSYDRDSILAAGGKLKYTLSGADEWQSVEVVAYDAAGNVARTGKWNVFISGNRLRQLYENKPLFFGLIFGVAGATGIFLFLLLKKKRDKKEKKTNNSVG